MHHTERLIARKNNKLHFHNKKSGFGSYPLYMEHELSPPTPNLTNIVAL